VISEFKNIPDNNDSSLHSGDNNKDNDDLDGTFTETREQETQRIDVSEEAAEV
jgi:hypothetical protein